MNIKEILHTMALRYLVRKNLDQGHIGKNSHIHTPSILAAGSLSNIYLGDNCNIDWNNTLFCTPGKFIMKKNSGAAVGLTVITGNHIGALGDWFKNAGNSNLEGRDVIVEEDVWIASNVTLLSGAHIGRGCIVGAGSVIRNLKVPPYSVVVGNPAKVIAFRFSPEEIIEHEKILYPETERLPLELLELNYKKYFLDHIKEIKAFTGLICK